MSEVMLFVTVELELTAPATVAAPERNEGDNRNLRPLAREGRKEGANKPWISPSSLAGSFRGHLGPQRGPALMGEEPEGEQDTPDAVTGRPSRVRFLGTLVHLLDANAPVQVRHRAALDRHRGAAASGQLHTTEQLPPGTRMECHLRVDGLPHHAEVLEALRSWRPVIGAGRTTGQGSTRTVGIRYTTVDLGTAEGRRTWLTGGGTGLLTGARHLEPSPPEEEEPLLTADWEVIDALHTGTGEQRQDEPAALLRDHGGRPLIPGSTWKGLLRSRCSSILASLGRPVCTRETCGCCDVCNAFGWSGPGGARGARGLLRFPDTPLRDARTAERQHVALDRVFGGAADEQLYTHEVAENGRASLQVHADGEVSPALLAALRHALFDLHSGLIGVGGSSTRGYGTLRCTDPQRAESWRTAATDHFSRHLEAA